MPSGSRPGARPGGHRRALAGIEPGGTDPLGPPCPPAAGRMLGADSGQALPLVLGLALALVVAGLFLALLGSAATSRSRLQRAADLARTLRRPLDARRPPPALRSRRSTVGRAEPRRLSDAEYRDRARAAAEAALLANGLSKAGSRVSFGGLRIRSHSRSAGRGARGARRQRRGGAGQHGRRGRGLSAWRAAAAAGPNGNGRRLLGPAGIRQGSRCAPTWRRRSTALPPQLAGTDTPSRSTRRFARTPSRPRSSLPTRTRAGWRHRGRRSIAVPPSSTWAPSPRTDGWRPTPAGSASSSATSGVAQVFRQRGRGTRSTPAAPQARRVRRRRRTRPPAA